MGVKESNIIKEMQVAVSRLGHRLFRNQTGTAWQGQVLKTRPGIYPFKFEKGDIVIRNPRFISFGLVKGGHDTIGFKVIIITPEMVGRKIAQFFCREVKTKNAKVLPEQINFNNYVNEQGGDAKIVYSVEEAVP